MKSKHSGTTSGGVFSLCKDKFKQEKYLNLIELNTLKSELFSEDHYQNTLDYIKDHNDHMFVIKLLIPSR